MGTIFGSRSSGSAAPKLPILIRVRCADDLDANRSLLFRPTRYFTPGSGSRFPAGSATIIYCSLVSNTEPLPSQTATVDGPLTAGRPTIGHSRLFYIDRTIVANHHTISLADRKYAFYVSLRSRGLNIREGLDKKSPIVTVSSTPFLSRKVTVGLGDPADA